MAAAPRQGSYGSFPPQLGGQILPQEAGTPPQEAGSILRSGPFKGLGRSRVNVWELILVPWLCLALVLGAYLLGGARGVPLLLWLLPTLLVALAALFVRHHYRQGNNAEVVLGLLCALAVVIGLVVGSYSVVKNLNEYYRLSQGASYFDVLPSESALSKRDAAVLVFANSSAVDVTRALGFVDVRTTSTTVYCVAPVSSGDERRIQFWAAGQNCCERRGNFQCGAARDSDAHGAVVLPMSTQRSEGYDMAVAAAQAAFGLVAEREYLLLEWQLDPVRYRERLWSSTLTLFAIFAGAYLVVSCMVGCALMPVVVGGALTK